MSERHRVIPSVQMVVFDDNDGFNVLLQRRANTGYRDGQYDLPSGHIEENEMAPIAAVRELGEEAGLTATPDDFELFHLTTNDVESPGKPYLYLFFKIALAKCQGQYRVMEPNKCDDIGMFPVDNLPKNTTPHTVTALQYISSKKVTFSNMGIKD